MENQVNQENELNAPLAVIVMGVVFGAILFLAVNATFANALIGAVVGLGFALVYNYIVLPFKPHDR